MGSPFPKHNLLTPVTKFLPLVSGYAVASTERVKLQIAAENIFL